MSAAPVARDPHTKAGRDLLSLFDEREEAFTRVVVKLAIADVEDEAAKLVVCRCPCYGCRAADHESTA